MRIAFRVDASSQIGTGHFMRCLTLATELKSQGNHIRFMSRHLTDNFRKALIEKDIELVQLRIDPIGNVIDELAHSHWLGVAQLNDAHEVSEALSGCLWDWIIVDHYALDWRWENAVRPCSKMLMAIDDLADRTHDCDVLLDQNYYQDMDTRYNGKIPENCILLLGPSYALLRDEFRVPRNLVRPRSKDVERILISFGGIDTNNFTSKVMDALVAIRYCKAVDVVIGDQHPNRDDIKNMCVNHGYICHIQTSRMAELMMEADLAICAGGSSIWECCSLGVPSIIAVMAENQKKVVDDLNAVGAIISLGSYKEIKKTDLERVICMAISDSKLRFNLSSRSLELMDVKEKINILRILNKNYV